MYVYLGSKGLTYWLDLLSHSKTNSTCAMTAITACPKAKTLDRQMFLINVDFILMETTTRYMQLRYTL